MLGVERYELDVEKGLINFYLDGVSTFQYTYVHLGIKTVEEKCIIIHWIPKCIGGIWANFRKNFR
jgi:hypothetical protein